MQFEAGSWESEIGIGVERLATAEASEPDPWVRQTRARILACIPASGDDLEPLLGQIGLTAAPRGRDTDPGA
jgi:hypothetical protein